MLNAANEVAVEAFLAGAIRFDQIHAVNADTIAAVLPSWATRRRSTTCWPSTSAPARMRGNRCVELAR